MTMAMMSGLGNDRNDETVENLILDLVEWLARKGRSYQETIEAWRTSCPRLPEWEEATERGFVETASANDCWLLRATPAGWAFLKEGRP
jgi:D-3-phosphoglycerate dehydrogenase